MSPKLNRILAVFLLLALAAPMAQANPFASAWRWITRQPEPPPPISGECPAPEVFVRPIHVTTDEERKLASLGPRLEMKHVDQYPCLLELDIPAAWLREFKDPAVFLRARIAHQFPPTEAHWVDNLTGHKSRMSQFHMTTLEQAKAVQYKFFTFGCPANLEEARPENAFSRAVYPPGEERRHYNIDGHSAGLVRLLYAKYTIEEAERILRAELSEKCK